MPRAASRVGLLGTETALDVLVKARAVEAHGRQVIHLEVGEPDFPTPGHIVEAGVRALRDGHTRYGPPAGSPGLREAIAEHLAQRGVRANPEHVLVTPGAKPNLFYGFLATLSPGDEALVPDPGFPIYASMVRFCGATPVPVPPRLDQGRALDLDVLERAITPRTRMVVFNSPSNPTGAVVPEADLRRLAALADRHDLWVMADEIYRRIRYGADAPSIAALPGMLERTILVDGFSKAYAMTGWRLGWGLFPPALAPPGGGGRVARWSGIRSRWIRIPPPLVCNFAGEPGRSRGPVLEPGRTALIAGVRPRPAAAAAVRAA